MNGAKPVNDGHNDLLTEYGKAMAERLEKELLGDDPLNQSTRPSLNDREVPYQYNPEDVPVLKDSGERRQFSTGAVRDRAVGKGRFDLIPTQLMFRLARHYEAGAIKYEDRNWEKGMAFSIYMDAALRHLFKYIAGWTDEDHLAAAIWNLAALTFQEEKNPQLDDLPDHKREAVDMFKWVMRRDEDA